jgi:uncharacterized protein YxeA
MDNRNLIWIIIIVLILIIIGGFLFYRSGNNPKNSIPNPYANQPGQSPTSTNNSSTSATSQQIEINLNQKNSSGESGIATLSPAENNKTEVVVSVEGFNGNTMQAAHIHAGPCSIDGPKKYPLNPINNGNSDTIINVSLKDLLAQAPLSLHVHKSTQDETLYSCGDITQNYSTNSESSY